MGSYFHKRLYIILLVLTLAMASGCAVRIGDFEVQIGDPERLEVGELQYEEQTISLDGIEAARVEVEMGAGKLTLNGDSEELMEAEFSFNVEEWKPEVNLDQVNGFGTLTVRQPLTGTLQAKNVKNEWTIRLTDGVPVDLFVRLGAGSADMDLRGLSLEDLDMELGAGKVVIDLSGDWSQDFKVHVKRGVGEAKLKLPASVGVRVDVAGGLGSVVILGLERQGEYYVNEAYGDAEVNIELDILGAIGSIELEVVE